MNTTWGKAKIVPAILEKDLAAIQEKVMAVKDLVDYVQIDVIDGVLAPQKTFPYSVGKIEEIALLDNLPVKYELDLMIDKPEQTLDVWLQTDTSRICIHYASTKKHIYCLNRIRESGKEAYLALTVRDLLDGIPDILLHLDGVQCMGISQIGKQGEPYTREVETLITRVREMDSSVIFSVDGGVSHTTAPTLIKLGVTQLVAGSAVFNGDVEHNIKIFRDTIS